MKKILLIFLLFAQMINLTAQEEIDNTMEISVGLYGFYLDRDDLRLFPGINLSGLIVHPTFKYGISSDVVPNILPNRNSTVTTSMVTLKAVYNQTILSAGHHDIYLQPEIGIASINNRNSGLYGVKLGDVYWLKAGNGINGFFNYSRLWKDVDTQSQNLWAIHLGYVKRLGVSKYERRPKKTETLPERSVVATIDSMPPIPTLFMDTVDITAKTVGIDEIQVITDTVYFAFDSDYVKSKERHQIEDKIQNLDVVYATVEGFTDDIGDSSYNERLSERRANAVASQLGVPTIVDHHGESYQLNSNKKLNRAVIVSFHVRTTK